MSRRQSLEHRMIESHYYHRKYPKGDLSGLSLMAGIPIAIGMNKISVGIALVVLGLSAVVFGIVRIRSQRMRGRFRRLTDFYSLLVGLALIGNGISLCCVRAGMDPPALKRLVEQEIYKVNGVIFATLGIVCPILNALDHRLFKKRCGEPLEAEVADVIQVMARRSDGVGEEFLTECCPVFRIWRDGKTKYVCDEMFSSVKFAPGESCQIYVHPAYPFQIYDEKRAKKAFEISLIGWIVYDVIVALILGIVWM
ncbi:MAG: hypothetical protein IK130_07090 [Oscillospiraceae bacterium]|nr:hypothetical protein [Oscillospiraceae bacterium]